MHPEFVELPHISLQARPEELFFIDEAVHNYVIFLRGVVQLSAECDEIINQLRAFQQRYEQFLTGKPGGLCHRGGLESSNESPLVGWQTTSFELIAFGSAVIAYLRFLEVAQVPEKRRRLAFKHLTTFQVRYLEMLTPV